MGFILKHVPDGFWETRDDSFGLFIDVSLVHLRRILQVVKNLDLSASGDLSLGHILSQDGELLLIPLILLI